MDSGGPHGIFAAGGRETGNYATGCSLAAGRGQESVEVGGNAVHTYIYLQAPSESGTVVVPPEDILNGRSRGETTREQYAGTDTGDAQVVG